MDKLNGVNVYNKVYDELLKLDVDRIYKNEFYTLIEKMKIGVPDIVATIEQVLIDAGFNEQQIFRVSNNLSFKLRFSKRDARYIEKHLKENGNITRRGNLIIINKDSVLRV